MSANYHESFGASASQFRQDAGLFLIVLADTEEQGELPLDKPIPPDEPELPGIPPR